MRLIFSFHLWIKLSWRLVYIFRAVLGFQSDCDISGVRSIIPSTRWFIIMLKALSQMKSLNNPEVFGHRCLRDRQRWLTNTWASLYITDRLSANSSIDYSRVKYRINASHPTVRARSNCKPSAFEPSDFPQDGIRWFNTPNRISIDVRDTLQYS
jgi:hypothetical protein